MSQVSDVSLANQGFSAFRTELNNILGALNTSHIGSSAPASLAAGSIWVDTSGGATAYVLKFYDGADHIQLGTINTTANTVDWTDSSVTFDIVNDTSPQLGGDLDVNSNDITGTGDINITGTVTATSYSGDGSSLTGITGGTAWQTVKTGNFTAVASEGYFVNTTSGAITATLPASPTQGDEVSFIDYAATFDTNNLTIARNGKPIQGDASDLTVATERAGLTLVFVDDTQGWLLREK
jgi:hypothetical protein